MQGGDQPDLRIRSAEALKALDLKGYAIGGLAVGEPQAVMLQMLETTLPVLPSEKPRYLMGVGTPEDILKSVAVGVDMFDCVMPTRSGRHGLAFTRRGKVNIRNARHAEDLRRWMRRRPARPRATIPAYLHHLVRSNEALGGMLLSWHTIWPIIRSSCRAFAPQLPRTASQTSMRKRWKTGRGETSSRFERCDRHMAACPLAVLAGMTQWRPSRSAISVALIFITR